MKINFPQNSNLFSPNPDARATWKVFFALLSLISSILLTLLPATAAISVRTFNCQSVENKPDSFFFACADGNEGITKIKWKNWSMTGANGVGEYFVNICNPDCASGKFEFVPVKLSLTRPVKVKGKIYLTSLSYSQTVSMAQLAKIIKKVAPTNKVSKIKGTFDLYQTFQEMQGKL
jgi:hypothetical protein